MSSRLKSYTLLRRVLKAEFLHCVGASAAPITVRMDRAPLGSLMRSVAEGLAGAPVRTGVKLTVFAQLRQALGTLRLVGNRSKPL